MRKPTYTPGPWFADGVFIETEGGIMGRHIATVASATRESQANAVVIAAAPELVASLRSLLAAQEAARASTHDVAPCHRLSQAEAVAVALLARLPGTVAGEPKSDSLSGSV